MNPPPLPRCTSEQSALKKAFTVAVGIVGALILFGLATSNDASDKKASTNIGTPTTATTETSDPCGWAKRPSGMTREACERLAAVQFQLWREEQLERDPNFKPYRLNR